MPKLNPKNPINGGKITLSPTNIINLILGGTILSLIWNFSKAISGRLSTNRYLQAGTYLNAVPIGGKAVTKVEQSGNPGKRSYGV